MQPLGARPPFHPPSLCRPLHVRVYRIKTDVHKQNNTGHDVVSWASRRRHHYRWETVAEAYHERPTKRTHHKIISHFFIQGSCTSRHKRFKAFHSMIRGLLPIDHSIAYNATGTGTREKTPIWSSRAWRLLIISGLRQFFYPLNSNYGRKFSQSPSLVDSFT